MGKSEEVLQDNNAGRIKKSFASLILRRVNTLNPATETKKLEIPEPKIGAISDEMRQEQSRMAKLDIARRARENQEYYLMKHLEDQEKKPWFTYPKFGYQYSEFVLISPEMAQILLDHLWSKETGNRNTKPDLVDAYLRDIEQDHWVPTDESIGINLSFEVYNGRHRLLAIIAANKAMPMYVTWNVLDEAKFFIESGAIRSLSERLNMVIDPLLGNRTSGFCKAAMRGTQPRIKFTNSEVAEFAHKWSSLIEWISKNYPNGRAEVQAVLAKAYLWYGPELIEPFCERLREIRFEEDDPAKNLFLALQTMKKRQQNQALVAYKKTLQAVDALLTNRAIGKLHKKNEDIFEWQPGWELPPKNKKK